MAFSLDFFNGKVIIKLKTLFSTVVSILPWYNATNSFTNANPIPTPSLI